MASLGPLGMPPKAPLARRLARQIIDPGFKPPAAAVEIELADGRVLSQRIADVIPATPEQVRSRFRAAAGAALGEDKAVTIERFTDRLEAADDVGRLPALTALSPTDNIRRIS